MSVNDPLGDMLTRIRNAQLRGKSTVSTPASKLRAWVLDVLADEGYIRGYERKDSDNGQGELVISLKYFEGETGDPRSEARVEAGPPRVHEHQGHPDRSQRFWVWPSSRPPRA